MFRAAAILLALSFAGASAQQQPEADRLFAAAMTAQQRGDIPTAIRDYQRLLQLNPKLTDARVNLGAALAKSGRLDDAIAQYTLALTAMPENAEVRRNLGLAYYKKGDVPDAMREFTEVRKQEPRNAQLAILLGDCELKSGKPNDAVAMLEPLEAENGANQDFEYVLGMALLASGKRRDGATKLQHVAEAAGGPDVYFIAGATWLDLNDLEVARKDLEVALKANPNFPRIYTLLGTARDRNGDPDAAAVAFREALKANPQDFEANLYLGAILLKKRDLPEARPYLEKAIQLDPKSTLARYEHAMYESTSGEYAGAATDLETVTNQDPKWLEPHVELATVYYKLHRPDDGAKQRAIVAKLTEEQQQRGPGK